MGLLNKMREPIFLKESSSAERQLEQLQSIDKNSLSDDLKKQLELEINLVTYGFRGEKSVEFELRNSHMPMFVLHDLHLTHGDLSAQIDYIVITRKITFVLECKNLFGNIEIDSSGTFIRTVKYNKHTHREAIYSPITQNQRHMDLIKQLLRSRKKNALLKAAVENVFPKYNRSVIVLANPKTILNDRAADELIKKQVIRADALISHIKQICNQSSEAESSDKNMEKRATFFLDNHVERNIDFAKKYRTDTSANYAQMEPQSVEKNDAPSCPKCDAPMVLRTAKKGTNAGKQFWGCSMFPKCRASQ